MTDEQTRAHAQDESGHMTYNTIVGAFDAWRKTLKVVDRPSNQEIFSQGYVAGWNAREVGLPERVPVQLTDSAHRLWMAINGHDITDFAKRAEHILQSSLDGLTIGENNRASVKALLVEHFEQIAASRSPAGCWQPVETAPKDVEVLMCWEVEWPERRWEYASGLWGSTRGGWNHGQATHWMQLPSPPHTSTVHQGEIK